MYDILFDRSLAWQRLLVPVKRRVGIERKNISFLYAQI